MDDDAKRDRRRGDGQIREREIDALKRSPAIYIHAYYAACEWCTYLEEYDREWRWRPFIFGFGVYFSFFLVYFQRILYLRWLYIEA